MNRPSEQIRTIRESIPLSLQLAYANLEREAEELIVYGCTQRELIYLMDCIDELKGELDECVTNIEQEIEDSRLYTIYDDPLYRFLKENEYRYPDMCDWYERHRYEMSDQASVEEGEMETIDTNAKFVDFINRLGVHHGKFS